MVLKAIEKVVNGEVCYCPEAANRVLTLMKRTGINPMKRFSKPNFTSLQLSVLSETGKGLSAKEVAQKLKIERGTVVSTKQKLLGKTGCRNSMELALYAVRHFLVD